MQLPPTDRACECQPYRAQRRLAVPNGRRLVGNLSPGSGRTPVFRGPSPSTQGGKRHFARRVAEGSSIPPAAARPVDAAGGALGGSLLWLATAFSATSKSPSSGYVLLPIALACDPPAALESLRVRDRGWLQDLRESCAAAEPRFAVRPPPQPPRFSILVAPCRWQARKQSFTVSWCLRRSVRTRQQASRD